jgi:hypothetical protein
MFLRDEVKDLIRITLGRDKTSVSHLGFLHLACAVLNIRRDAVLGKEVEVCP